MHNHTDVYYQKIYTKIKFMLPKGGDSLPSSNPESRSLSLFLCLCPRCLWRRWLFLPPSGTWTPMNNVLWPIGKKKLSFKKGLWQNNNINSHNSINDIIIITVQLHNIDYSNVNNSNIIDYNNNDLAPQIHNPLIQVKIPVLKSLPCSARLFFPLQICISVYELPLKPDRCSVKCLPKQ